VLETHLVGIQGQVRALLDNGSKTLGETGQGSLISRDLHRVLEVKAGTLKVLIATALVYCIIEGVEAVGLWLERRWAEYLTAVATAGFLPFEVRELAKRVTVFRASALVVNGAILVYLVWAKRLFGLRGGPHEQWDDVNWEELLGERELSAEGPR
jgi:uncharacterized membrane protein (DUF2068 family)